MTPEIDRESQLRHLRRAAGAGDFAIQEFVLPQSSHVLAGDIRLHYLDWGSGAHGGAVQNIVFLHGGGLTAHTWDLVCLGLRDRYRCVAVDLRGHGDSEWSAGMEYSLHAYANDIQRFIDALGLERLVLVGMSLGGLAAIELASSHGDRLDALVLVDVGPELRDEGTQRIGDFISQPSELESVDDFVARAMSFNERRDPELLRRSLLHNLRQLPSGRWTWKYDRRHWGGGELDSMRQSRLALAQRLPAISCETLVVRGEHSDVFWDEDAEKLVESLPAARWIKISDAGHAVQGDNPRELTKALREFLASLDDAKGETQSRR